MKPKISRPLLAAAIGIFFVSLSPRGNPATFFQDPPPAAKLPDLATVIPQQLQIVNPVRNAGKSETLRFSNGIANIGDGPLRMRPEFPLADPALPQRAIQEILDSTDSSGAVLLEHVASEFEFHPDHYHWHIDAVAQFTIHTSTSSGTISSADIGPVLVNGNGASVSTKTTFCLIDWIKLEGNTNTGSKSDRVYWDCFGEYQGISVGWVDQYHHATTGQQLDLTGAPEGLYYLVSISNPDGNFLEKDLTNNHAWTAFWLSRQSDGNAKIEILADSFAAEGIGVAPEYTTNR